MFTGPLFWLNNFKKALLLLVDTVLVNDIQIFQGFSKLCYNLVQDGTIKMSAFLNGEGDKLIFPHLQNLTLDLGRY